MNNKSRKLKGDSYQSMQLSYSRQESYLIFISKLADKICCIIVQGPVVRTPVSASPGLNFNPGFFFFLSKALYRIILSILFRVSNHQIEGKVN